MILDAEIAPKSPVSSQPTVRHNPVGSPSTYTNHVSYSTFSRTRDAVITSNHMPSESSALLYPQSVYDDAQPPAYDEINPQRPKGARTRFWTRAAAVLLLVFLVGSTLISYRFSRGAEESPRPPSSGPKLPSTSSSTSSTTSSTISSTTSSRGSSPEPTLLPLPPHHLPTNPDAPFIYPTSGRRDLCHTWAHSMHLESHPSIADNRQTDKLVYEVPNFDPIHLETRAICPTKDGGHEFCDDYDDSQDSVAGKLHVISGDVKLPEIHIALQRGSQSGLDNVSVCLMRKLNDGANKSPSEDNSHKWVLGLYALKDRKSSPGQNDVLFSASIVLTLPRARAHNLSTHLNYFTQTIGPRPTEPNLLFDRLSLHAGERGEVAVLNVSANVIEASSTTDMVILMDCRVTQQVNLTSELGLLQAFVTLAHAEGGPPAQANLYSTYGSLMARTVLEYPPTLRSPPRYELEVHSQYGVAVGMVVDPQASAALRVHQVPNTLPIILVNATSHFAMAQASVPPSYFGSVQLNSEYASVVVKDRAKEVTERVVEWDTTGKISQANVRLDGQGDQLGSGSVFVSSYFSTSRMLFLGLNDDKLENWPEDKPEVRL